jgi:hypothetical protein
MLNSCPVSRLEDHPLLADQGCCFKWEDIPSYRSYPEAVSSIHNVRSATLATRSHSSNPFALFNLKILQSIHFLFHHISGTDCYKMIKIHQIRKRLQCVERNMDICLIKSSIFWDMIQTCCLLHADIFSGIFFCLEMEIAFSSETSVDFQLSTQCYIPEDRILCNHHSESLFM